MVIEIDDKDQEINLDDEVQEVPAPIVQMTPKKDKYKPNKDIS